MSSSKPIELMNAYKGSIFAHPSIILSGVVFGIVVPRWIVSVAPLSWMATTPEPVQNIVVVLKSFMLIAFLFLSEFVLGVMARGQSVKAAFSPAGAQFSGVAPYALVEANRIHQNHIEAAVIYIPATLAAAAAGADANILVAYTITWVVARVLFRWGYVQEYPLWRAFGLFASLTQIFQVMYLFFVHEMN